MLFVAAPNTIHVEGECCFKRQISPLLDSLFPQILMWQFLIDLVGWCLQTVILKLFYPALLLVLICRVSLQSQLPLIPEAEYTGWFSLHFLKMSLCLRFLFWLLLAQINFYGSIIGLHCCVSFCCTRKWISSVYTYIPSLLDLAPTPLCIPSEIMIFRIYLFVCVCIAKFC